MGKLTDTLSLRLLSAEEAATPELLPYELRNFQFPYLVPDWCWVVEENGFPIALVVTSFAHGILMFWRVLSTAKGSRNWFLAALPRILENATQRGCLGYGTFLHDDRPAEVQIARILQKNGAVLKPLTGTQAIGTMEPHA
jgi:hypothetical protein